MALTLPYPSMNFVPLDILTAAEQNQLVANIEYIANQFPIKSFNIDWSTVTKTITDTNGRTGVYFGDGTLIAYRNITGMVDIATAWGSLYRGQILSSGGGVSFTPSTGEDFIEKPKVSIRVGATSSTTFMVASWTNSDPVSSIGGRWGFSSGSTALIRPTSASNVPFSVDIIAIGRWKD